MLKKTNIGGPVQRFIRRALDARRESGEQPDTRYKLALACGWKPDSVYQKLTAATSIETIERMLGVLNARIQIGDETIELRLTGNDDVAWKRIEP